MQLVRNFLSVVLVPRVRPLLTKTRHLSSNFESKLHVNMSVSIRPEGVLRNWDLRKYTVKDLEDECNEAVGFIQKFADDIASADTVSYETILKPRLECVRIYGKRGTLGSLFPTASFVSESEEIRSTSTRLQGILADAFVNLEMRRDVYDKLVEYQNVVKSNPDKLKAELRKCLEKLILVGRRNGLEQSEEVQRKVKSIQKEMSALSLEFQKNFNEENTLLQFDETELRGMDAEFITGLKKDPETGKFIVTLKYPDYIPLMEKCTVPETRRELEFRFSSRCTPANSKILKKLILLRAEHAIVLGYPSHAAYVQEILMAENPNKVESFFQKLVPNFSTHYHAEQAEMLKLKEKECSELGIEFDGKLNRWDLAHYFHLMTEEKFSLNTDLLKQYFPLQVVLDGMLLIYQQLLGLKFSAVADAETWHSDVTVHQVDDAETGERLGYFYLDLFPRAGKYGHACCLPIQQGCLDNMGQRIISAVVLICNFPRPVADTPSLLSHNDVETLFHEFGHAMHHLCSKAETPLFHGTSVQSDFLEAPSQMLENWCYQKESLQLMSKHFKTGAPLPEDMIQSLVKSKAKDAGSMSLRQIVYAITDQRLHNTIDYPDDFEPLDTFRETSKEIMGLDVTPGTNTLASFSHLAGGYDARYYSYMWSLVYSQDMFDTIFSKDGVLNPVAGKRYRECILQPGGALDGMELLKNFLGREPSLTPFLLSKGLL